MKKFMGKNFLLQTETAKVLYHEHAAKMPIIDFHNHLNVQEILEDKQYDNIAEVWLGVDHYKWRAMRADGFSEELITGSKRGTREQFEAWAKTIQDALGNPLYHWTHLELQRYFNVFIPLAPDSADIIWNICNERIATKEYSVRNLLKMQNVEILCTTDDPADDLENHIKLRESGYELKVLPTFRPEKAIGIEKEGFAEYVGRLADIYGTALTSVGEFLDCLKQRLDFFVKNGCRVTDHSLESRFYCPASEEAVDSIFRRRLNGEVLTAEECAAYHGYMLRELGKEYARRGLVMQLHIGALRNNSSRMFNRLGPDHGFDSLADFAYAEDLSALLNDMDKTGELPKTILYYLNPKDAEMLAGIAGDFQTNEEGVKGKIQLGTAWWFCDHKTGMENQMTVMENAGLLSGFIGMLTDSRSFLSFPRHEYFRRILCNHIGLLVENGEYPADMEYLGQMVENICGGNARAYFNFD